MPLVDGEYKKLTKKEIKQRLENSLENKLDTTAQPGDLITKQLAAEAETLARNQEEALERVHQAAYLADATGKELDKVVDIIGLTRDKAKPATGVIELWRETPPASTYIIPKGSEIQTGGREPIQFELTEQTSLVYIDGFEANNLNNWEGDKSNFSILNSSEIEGNYLLQTPDGSDYSITTVDSNFSIGTTFTLNIKPDSGDVTAFRFGLQDQSNYFECTVDENAQDLSLALIEDDSEVTSSTNNSATIPTSNDSYLEITWGMYEDSKATLYETKSRDNELCSVTLSESREWKEGAFSVASLNSTTNALIDEITTRSVLANAEAVDTGVKTNLGPDTINNISGSITGVEQVNNPVATGKPTNSDMDFEPFAIGEDRESDEELRERAFDTTAIGGAATVNALKTELLNVDGVKALTLNRNRTENQKNGLPAHSFEAIVYGGTDEDIGNVIFNTASIDSHDVGGIHGTEATYDIQSNVTNSTETISWSRPVRANLNLTLDLIVDDTFVGETEIRSIIVNYIGGTGVDGEFVTGLDVGEDVYEAILKRKVVSPEETGVWEVDSLTIDSNDDGNDDTTTTASGADVLGVADNEVAITDARDGSITVNTTQK
jgi:uncharacterized phage protein gp47/JayE